MRRTKEERTADLLGALVAYGPITTDALAKDLDVSYIYVSRLLEAAIDAGFATRIGKRTPMAFEVTDEGKGQLWYLEA